MRTAHGCLCLTVALTLAFAVPARAAVVHSHATTPSQASTGGRPASKPRAPNAPPLGSMALTGQGEETAGLPSAAGDQLVENGLSSPLCSAATRGALSRAAKGNCETSRFVGASNPTNNYELDVHIDTGVLGLSKGSLASVIQDTFVGFGWMAIVWSVHALVVMLEWCYSLELLGSSTMGSVARSLQQAQATFTEPWLALVLAVASMLALYDGLIRRRIAETLGQALLMLAMMALGLWVIADPLGTVGAVEQWANQASLGTVGAIAQGTPSNAPRTLGEGMRAVFSGTIEAPWCYLEFGNVRWCDDPALLEPRLRKAAAVLVATQRPGDPKTANPHLPELVRGADTNGKLFLAFPANGPERNSVKDAGSLLHVLCRTEDDTKCTGPAAAEAEFRSDGGTVPRMIGLGLIAGGTLGMALLFGLVAMRLLAAAVMSLFLLLLAPFAVLAPALGDGGRTIFAAWASRLLGEIASKLIFSFVLGALLAMQRILISLPLGWLTQWLLVSAFWWGVFFKRHQVATLLRNPAGVSSARSFAVVETGAARASRRTAAALRPVHWARGRLPAPALPVERLAKRDSVNPAHREHSPVRPVVPVGGEQA
jgi:hypothetical protein